MGIANNLFQGRVDQESMSLDTDNRVEIRVAGKQEPEMLMDLNSEKWPVSMYRYIVYKTPNK